MGRTVFTNPIIAGFGPLRVKRICPDTTRPLISISTIPCCVWENVQEISGGSAGDSKIEDHKGRCLGLKGINSFPA